MKIKFVKRNEYALDSSITFDDPSLTQQQYKDECDVNRQIERLSIHLMNTGDSLENVVNNGALYGDFSEIPDFTTYNKIVADSKEKFEALDPKIRQRFNNSPEVLFDFLLDENNRDEAIKLGLVNAPILNEIKSDLSVDTSDIKVASTGSSDASDKPI